MSHRLPARGKLASSFWKHRFYYFLMAPGLLYFLVFCYIPIVGLLLAFKEFMPLDGFQGIFTGEWVGIKYFQRFFESYYFWNVLKNTLTISGLKLLLGFPAPIILALLLNEVGNRHYKRIVQSISYIPHFFSMVVIAGLLQKLLSADDGIVNYVIVQLGGQPISFLSDPKYFIGVLVGSSIWQSIGWGSIIYLSALSGIDPELYEAATIDGAGHWKQTLYVTLPGISNVVVIMLIMSVGGIMNAGFEQVLMLYSPPVYPVADIIDTFVYREGIEKLNYSYSTAVGMFKSVIALMLVLGTNWIAKRLGQEGIW